jgi:hypothetical protein
MEAATATDRATFERTTEQRMQALALANEIRMGRAQLKRDMKVGRRHLRELLEQPPELIDTMKILDLLLAAPKVGRVKATKMLSRAQVAPSKAVGRLSPRQRCELLALLAAR